MSKCMFGSDFRDEKSDLNPSKTTPKHDSTRQTNIRQKQVTRKKKTKMITFFQKPRNYN